MASDERERFVGKEGLRAMGVFLRDSLTRASLIVVNGNLLLGSGCMQSSNSSCTHHMTYHMISLRLYENVKYS